MQTNKEKRQTTVEKEFDQIREQYASDPRSDTINLLSYGDWGSGKTTFAATGRYPILFHSFDPGGTTSIRDKIESGNVLADTQWEMSTEGFQDLKGGVSSKGVKTVTDPDLFEKWAKEVNRLHEMGFFSSLGTFVIDSYTTFSDALMAFVKKKRGTLGSKNTFDDWGANREKTKDVIKQLMSLPCNVVLTAHQDTERDETTGDLVGGPMAAGKLTKELPLLFDEVYYHNVEGEGEDVTYQLHMKKHRFFPARSRLASQHSLGPVIEDPSLKGILKKAGYPITPVE